MNTVFVITKRLYLPGSAPESVLAPGSPCFAFSQRAAPTTFLNPSRVKSARKLHHVQPGTQAPFHNTYTASVCSSFSPHILCYHARLHQPYYIQVTGFKPVRLCITIGTDTYIYMLASMAKKHQDCKTNAAENSDQGPLVTLPVPKS